MKKLTMAALIVFLAVVGLNHASAEMVDIGLGQMEQTEFLALKALVDGQPADNEPAVATPLERPEQYGMLEMSQADFEALRDAVGGRSNFGAATPETESVVQMVNIGTGEMPLDEFLALKRLVEEKDAFVFGRLAVAQP